MRSALLSLMLAPGAAAAALADPTPPVTLPTPYTAEQIRAAWQPGFSVEMQTTEAGVVSRTRMTVLSATPEAAVIREESLRADGTPGAPATESETRWSELRDHARFEATNATRERAECRALLGSLPGWSYAVQLRRGGTMTLCFADATPGPPVVLELAHDGKVLSRMEHVRYGRPQRGAEE